MTGKLGAILREPLLHFAAVGAVLVGAHAALEPAPEPAAVTASRAAGPRQPIVVDDAVRAQLIATWRLSHQAPPSEAELAALIDAWIDDELLYREGLARGLDQGDPEIRARIAGQMQYLLEARLPAPEPSEAELRAHFQAHAERYADAELIDFSQVFVDGHGDAARARADELLALLQRGASPAGLGDSFSGGRRYRRRKLPDLAQHFGDEFVAGMDLQPEGSWALRRSRFGFHLVRIDDRSPARLPRFDEVRDQVAHDLRSARRAEALDAAIAELRGRYQVEIAP